MSWRWTFLATLGSIPLAVLLWLGFILPPDIFQRSVFIASIAIRGLVAYLFVKRDASGPAMLHGFVWGCVTRLFTDTIIFALPHPDNFYELLSAVEIWLPDLRLNLIGWEACLEPTNLASGMVISLMVIPAILFSGVWQLLFVWVAKKIRANRVRNDTDA